MSRYRYFIALGICLLLYTPPASAYDPEYLNEVVGRRAVSLGDGFELILVLLNLEETHTDFESQKAFMSENRLLKKSMEKKEKSAPLRRGELAYMLCKALKLKGGIKARIFGLNEAFAMEELIHQGILRAGHRHDLVTGQELVVIMTRAAEHMKMRLGEGSPS